MTPNVPTNDDRVRIQLPGQPACSSCLRAVQGRQLVERWLSLVSMTLFFTMVCISLTGCAVHHVMRFGDRRTRPYVNSLYVTEGQSVALVFTLEETSYSLAGASVRASCAVAFADSAAIVLCTRTEVPARVETTPAWGSATVHAGPCLQWGPLTEPRRVPIPGQFPSHDGTLRPALNPARTRDTLTSELLVCISTYPRPPWAFVRASSCNLDSILALVPGVVASTLRGSQLCAGEAFAWPLGTAVSHLKLGDVRMDRRVFLQPLWWRFPARALLLPPAVIIDIALLPYYAAWLVKHGFD